MKVKYRIYVQNPDSTLKESKVYSKKDFVGMAHWGVFGEQVDFFDLNQYQNMDMVEPNHKPKVFFNKTVKGYQYTIEFNPKNLLFAKYSELSKIYCGVLIFDKDKDCLSLYANNTKYKWAGRTWLPEYRVKPPIKLAVPDEYAMYQDHNTQFGSFFYFNNEKWNLYHKEIDQLNWWDNIPYVNHYPISVNRDTIFKGNEHFYLVNTGSSSVLMFQSKTNPKSVNSFYTHYTKPQLDSIQSYQFKDGSLGLLNLQTFMQSPWGSGPYEACEHELFMFVKYKDGIAKNIFEIDINIGNMISNWPASFELPESLLPDFKSSNWNKESEQLSFKCFLVNGEEGYDALITIGFNKEEKPILIRNEPIINE